MRILLERRVAARDEENAALRMCVENLRTASKQISATQSATAKLHG